MIIPILFGGKPTGPNLNLFLDAAQAMAIEMPAIHYTAVHTLRDFKPAQIKGAILRGWYEYVAELEVALEFVKKHHTAVIDTGLLNPESRHGKVAQHARLTECGLPCVPLLGDTNPANFSYPIVAKDIRGAQGKNVFLLNSLQELDAFLRDELLHAKTKFLYQQFVPNDGDYRVMVIGKKALPKAMLRQPSTEGEFRSNIALGGTGTSVPLTEEMRQLAEKAAACEDSDFCGVDLIQHKKTGEWYVLEVNHGPGFEGFQKATGINVAARALRLLVEKIKAV